VIDVRSAADSDIEAMAAIYIEAARAGWARILGTSNLEALEPPVDRLRAEFASTDARQHVLVAEKEGRVIAFAVVRQSRDEDAHGAEVGELEQFYSAPAVWGEGAGRKVMAAALGALRESGFTEATLWVAEENHRPRRIYEVAGWRYDGVTREQPWRGGSVRDLRYRIKL
jgi:L-amino acid N-acyltransferase YncA